jgi:hypothetical protein
MLAPDKKNEVGDMTMKITRRGANRNSGDTTIGAGRMTTVSWDAVSKSLQLSLHSVSDPSLSGEYNYKVHLDLSDVANMLNELADRGLRLSPREISEGTTDITRALHRLLAASAGLFREEPTQDGGLARKLLTLRTRNAGTPPETEA